MTRQPHYQREKLRRLKIRELDELIHKQPKEWLHKWMSDGADEYPVNVSQLIRNILWQYRTRVSKKEKEPLNELLRTFWYMYIKPTLSRAKSLSFERDQYEDMISTMVDMVKKWDLLEYKDIGFIDENSANRTIGLNPYVIIFSEKKGHHDFLLEMHKKYQVSIIALGHQPSVVNIEYFVDELKKRKVNLRKTFHLFSIVDYDTSGWILRDAFVDHLRHYKIKNVTVTDLVHPDMLTAEEVVASRFSIDEKKQTIKKNNKWLKAIQKRDYKNQIYLEPEIIDDQRYLYGLEAESISTIRYEKILDQHIPKLIGENEDLFKILQLRNLNETLKELMFELMTA